MTDRISTTRHLSRTRGGAFVKYLGLGLACVTSIVLLLVVQNSARQLLTTSEVMYEPDARTTPLIDLNGVELRARQNGSETLRMDAAHLVLFRDMRTVSVDGVTGGEVHSHDLPAVRFQAGHASFTNEPNDFAGGDLQLTGAVSAEVATPIAPIHVTTSNLEWRWPQGRLSADSPINATIGALGTLTCRSLQFDPVARSVEFGAVQITASVANLLKLASVDTTQGAPEASATSNSVTVNAPEGGHWDEQTRILSVRGPVVFKQGDETMETDGAIYDRNTNIAKALSPIKLYDSQNSLTGDHGEVNFGTHVAIITDNVVLKAIPPKTSTKQSSDNLDTEARQPTDLTCDHISYNYRTKLADADGHLKITQTNRTITAKTGHYDANAQVAELVGDVDAKSTDGKSLKSDTMKASLKQGDEWIEIPGPIQAEFKIDDADNPKPATTTTATTSPTGAKPRAASPPASATGK